MKKNPDVTARAACLLVVLLMGMVVQLRADLRYWDPDGNPGGDDPASGAGLGGSGTWDLVTPNWYDGVSGDLAWVNAADDAIITGSNGIVTLDAAITAQSILFTNVTGSYLLTNTSNGSLSFSAGIGSIDTGGSNHTIVAPIIGTGNLQKDGLGILTLGNSNSYSGTTIVNGGTLKSGITDSIPSGTAVTVNTGAILDLNGINQTVGSLAGAGNVTGNGASLTAGADGSPTVFSGVFSGSGGLTKVGGGVMTLSGSDTYTGPTTISAGTLQLGAANRIANSSAVTVATNAIFDMNSFSETIGSLAGSGVVNFQTAGTLTTGGDNTATTWSGEITGAGGLTKSGTNIMTLSSSNSYSGRTIINAGTLVIGNNDNRLGTPPVSATGNQLTFNGGTLRNTGSVTLNANRGISISSGGATFENSTGTGTTISSAAIVSGSGQLTKIGNGILRLTGANTMTGPVYILAGILSIDSSLSFGTGSTNVYIDAATLRNTSTAVGFTFVSANRQIDLGPNGGTFELSGAGGILQYAGTITATNPNTTLTKIGVAEYRAASVNMGFAKLAVNGGLYRINQTGSGEAGFGVVPATYLADAVTLNGGCLGTTPAITTPATRGITLGTNGGTFVLSGGWTINSIITGPGAFTLFTNGFSSSSSLSLTLGGVNSWAGPTVINGGTLVLNVAGALPTNTAVVFNSNNDFNTIGMTVSQNNTAASLSGGSSTNGTLSISSSRTFTVGDTNNTTFLGTVTGAGSFTKRGTGTFTLGLHDWANTGATTINQGTMLLADSAAGLGNSSALTIATGAVLDMNTFNDTVGSLAGGGVITNGGNLTVGNSTATATFSGSYTGTGTLTKNGTGQQILTGTNGFSAVTINAGTLQVNNGSGGCVGSGPVSVNSGGTLGGTGLVAGNVTVSGGGNVGAGASAGILTLANGISLISGGTNTWELAANSANTPGTDFDQLVLTGGNLVLGGSSHLLIKFTGSATIPTNTIPFWQSNHQWKIISLTGGAANSGPANFTSIDGTNGITAGSFSVSLDGGGSVLLNYTAAAVAPPAPVISSSIPGAGTGSAQISWSSVNGVSYQVQYKTNVSDPAWVILTNITATGASTAILDSTSPSPSQRFYRVIVP